MGAGAPSTMQAARTTVAGLVGNKPEDASDITVISFLFLYKKITFLLDA
jgi:hypothetical protein